MTPLQLLGFGEMHKISSHFWVVFRVFVKCVWQFDVVFGNFVPLSCRNFDDLTFLQ